MVDSTVIAFAGTPDFAVPSLELLADLNVNVALVLTQPDRPSGRGRVVKPSPVKRAATAIGLAVEQPNRLADSKVLASWGEPPDLMLVVAYGLLLPNWLLQWPKRGCINLHASLLPRWRGAAPIQTAILAGDEITGVSVMQMTAGLDSGPVFASESTPIGATETAAELHDRLSQLGAKLLRKTLPEILAGSCVAKPQDEADVLLAPKIRKSDAALDWRLDATELERKVRAFNSWPVAEAHLTDGRRLRIWRASVVTAEPDAAERPAAPGAIVALGPNGIDVAAGVGVLRLEEIQPPGAKVMSAAAYLAAHSLDDVAFAD